MNKKEYESDDSLSDMYVPLDIDNLSISSRLWARQSTLPEISENTRLSMYQGDEYNVYDFDDEVSSDDYSIIEASNDISNSLTVDKYKILLNLLNELEKEVSNPNLKIKMKNLSDDLLIELDKTPSAKTSIKSYFKNIIKKFSPNKKENDISSFQLYNNTIPIKSLKDISEKFVNKSLIENQTRRDAIFNISKSYYNKLKNLSEKYYQDLKETSDPKQIGQIKKNYNQESLKTIKLLRKNIISQFDNKPQNALSDIYKVFDKKIQELDVEKNKQLDQEESVQRQLEIKDYFNNEINELKDISEFYKGLSQNY